MTEISGTHEKLPAAIQRFVLHWGEMGGQWGVNRSVSQIHALLYLSERPLTAEEIAETLGMARSNVSNSLKELLGWNLIRRVPIMSARRDHFEAIQDISQLFRVIVEERKRRELDPTIALLRELSVEDPKTSAHVRQRLKSTLAFLGRPDGTGT